MNKVFEKSSSQIDELQVSFIEIEKNKHRNFLMKTLCCLEDSDDTIEIDY